MTHWSTRYLGLPHQDLGRDMTGADCWGLLRLVYAEELDVDLPSHDGAYHSAAEAAEIAALIEGAKDWSDWVPVTAKPAPFDAALFRRGPHRSHVGVIAVPGLMLHMAETGARIEDYRLPRWSGRLMGIYRHVSQNRVAEPGLAEPEP